jgi:predicted XRE-type DNA-binding protein
MSDEEVVHASSGNVFADLGLPDAEERAVKADLAQQIGEIIAQQGWTQAQAALALGIDQPKVSALLRGRLSGFSTDRLLRFLNDLEQDVEIVVTPKPAGIPRASTHVRRLQTGALSVAAFAVNKDPDRPS